MRAALAGLALAIILGLAATGPGAFHQKGRSEGNAWKHPFPGVVCDEATALAVVRAVAPALLGKEAFSSYAFEHAKLKGGEWVVSGRFRDELFPGQMVMPRIPTFCISKSDCKVMFVLK